MRTARMARTARTTLHDLPLTDFIPAISPRFTSPVHLQPMLDVLDRIEQGEQVKIVISTPPRHGKTETLLHSVAWMLARDPRKQIGYLSYQQRFAERGSRKARLLAEKAGLTFAPDQKTKANWRTGVDDGGLWATGIGGAVTGEGFHFMIVDDAVKDRADAESAVVRESTFDWFTNTAITRLEPKGSVVVNMTRWHPADLAGRLIDAGWEHINLQAISEKDGTALWPDRYSLEDLLEIKSNVGEYGWASLYQGQPRPKGGAVFSGVTWTETLPERYRVAIGIDFAYSSRSSADYSVAVVLATDGTKMFVLDVRRMQVESPRFAAELRTLNHRYPGSPIYSNSVAGPEKGIVDFMRSQGIPLEYDIARQDKFTRAQPISSHWNAGRVMLPRNAEWASAFLNEMLGFTGKGDAHDDQIDALTAAYAALSRVASQRDLSNLPSR